MIFVGGSPMFILDPDKTNFDFAIPATFSLPTETSDDPSTQDTEFEWYVDEGWENPYIDWATDPLGVGLYLEPLQEATKNPVTAFRDELWGFVWWIDETFVPWINDWFIPWLDEDFSPFLISVAESIEEGQRKFENWVQRPHWGLHRWIVRFNKENNK